MTPRQWKLLGVALVVMIVVTTASYYWEGGAKAALRTAIIFLVGLGGGWLSRTYYFKR